jgi:hypothetical protein
MDAKKFSPGEITIMAAGVVALLFSFLTFYENPFTDEGFSAWDSGLFPTATLMVIFVVIMAVVVALTKFTAVALPDLPFGFTWPQVHLVLGFFAALYALAWLVVDKGVADVGIGFWFVLLACLAAFVGAVLLQREGSGRSTPSGPPPAA